MANEPLRRAPPRPVSQSTDRPKIWAEGGQRPPFQFGAFWRAGVLLSRSAVAPLNEWAARGLRRGAEKVKAGSGRIPAEKLGRAARFVPSHLRVAAWIKNVAAVMAHASATADPDAKRGNALVAEIEPHLWDNRDPVAPPTPEPEPVTTPADPQPVVLAEPMPQIEDPLAAIRDDLAGKPERGRRLSGRLASRHEVTDGPALPPDPPGPAAAMAIQIIGYLVGWATTVVLLPYGLARALWLWVKGTDLRTFGRDG